jgi:hypothetical protein
LVFIAGVQHGANQIGKIAFAIGFAEQGKHTAWIGE